MTCRSAWIARLSLLAAGVVGLLFSGLPGIAHAQADPATAIAPPDVDPALRSGERASSDAALVIGNEAYDSLPQATYARADAELWADWLENTQGVRSSRIYRLSDASTSEIAREVKRRVWKTRRRGTYWVIFSGHGAMTAPEEGQRALLGRDADPDALGSDGQTLEAIAAQLLRNRRTSRVIFVLDAGFDGRGRDGLELTPGTRFLVADTVPTADNDRVVVWSAAPGADPNLSWDAAGHGMFTWAAQGGLRGWADGLVDGTTDGKVSLKEADAYATWSRRQLGVAARHGLVGLDDDMVLSEGSWLEAGPNDALMFNLSTQRRQQRFEDAQDLLQAEAAAFWQHTLSMARQGGEDGRGALEGFISEFGNKEIVLSWTVALPEVREARQLLARYDEMGAGTQAVQAVVAVAQEVEDASCDDLVPLEPDAMMGELSPGQIACLDLRVRSNRLQTSREDASKVLIINAQAAGDQGSWAAMVERHLDQISRADPNLVMQYVVWLFTTDPIERGEDTIHWAEVALENKQRWEGDLYIKNVGALLRIRAETAYKLWTDADRRYRSNASDDVEWEAEEYRGLAKDFSREWLDYLRAAGQNSELAMQICTSAAGTTDFCRAR